MVTGGSAVSSPFTHIAYTYATKRTFSQGLKDLKGESHDFSVNPPGRQRSGQANSAYACQKGWWGRGESPPNIYIYIYSRNSIEYLAVLSWHEGFESVPPLEQPHVESVTSIRLRTQAYDFNHFVSVIKLTCLGPKKTQSMMPF